jgi:hypothetical protein
MTKGIKLLVWGVVIIAIGFIAVTQYKNYLIKQIFAKGLLEDTPLNRTALANQNILQVLQTLRGIKAPSFESYEDTQLV